MASIGDPRWDVGSVFSDYLGCWLLSIPVTGEAMPDMIDRFWIMQFRSPMRWVRAADLDDTGISWKTTAFRVRRNLTGLSHGAAGIAHALLELFRETGHCQYLAVAKQAFDYERNWFNAGAGNWPDFREESLRGTQSKEALASPRRGVMVLQV